MNEDYQQKRRKLQKYMEEGDNRKALEAARDICDTFPEVYSTYYNLAFTQAAVGQFDNAVSTLEALFEIGGWWLPDDFEEFPGYESLASLPRFQSIMNKFTKRYEEAKKSSTLKWIVRIPEDYNSLQQYPILFALPYRDSNMEHFEPFWKDRVLSHGMILAVLQSSQIVSPDGYTWGDFELGLRELKQAYSEITEEYSVDAERVYLGGASIGGGLALHAVFNQPQFAVKGLIAVIPHGVTADDLPKDLESLAKDDVKCCLVAGTEDRSHRTCLELIERMKQHGLQYMFFDPKGIGHVIPPGFDKLLDEMIPFLIS